MAKPKVRADIKEATLALREVMREGLSSIADAMIAQIMKNYRNLTDSKRFDATKDVKAEGINAYRESLLSAMTVIAADALEKARKEVPKKKNVRLAEINEDALKLGEWEKLPPDLRRKLESQLRLLIGTQIADLEKVVYFQFNSSVDSTDSEATLKADLEDAAGEFVLGNSINGGASATSAQTINEARIAFFLDDEVSQEVEAFEFVNGDPVSPICTDLAGTIFAKDDPNLHRYYPPLHFNAVVSGTLIETDNGPIPIESISIGSKVKTHLGDFCEVYDVMSKFEDKEYLELTLEDGKTLKLTGEHPVLTFRGWVRADELLMADNIVRLEDLVHE